MTYLQCVIGGAKIFFVCLSLVLASSSLAQIDTTPPEITFSYPSGTLSAGLTNVRLRISTDESAECRYSENQGVPFDQMENVFDTPTSSTTHEAIESGLDEYFTHVFAVKCADVVGNKTIKDYLMIFSFGSTITGDYTLPSMPDINIVDADYGYVEMEWSKSFDNSTVVSYRLYRCEGDNCIPHKIIASPTTTLRYIDTDIARERSYAYQLTSVDDSANESPRSIVVRASSTPFALQVRNIEEVENEQGPTLLSPSVIASAPIFEFKRNLRLGDENDDVLELQKFLNNNGFAISSTGPGSAGSETRYFGALTLQSVRRFQESNREQILTPVGLRQGTGYFGPSTREQVNKILASNQAQSQTATKRKVRRELTPADRLRILTAQVRALQSAIERYQTEINDSL